MYTRKTVIRAIVTIITLSLIAYIALVASDNSDAVETERTIVTTTSSTVPPTTTTLIVLPPPTVVTTTTVPVSGDCATLEAALAGAGGNTSEIAFAIRIATRESHCRLDAYNGDSTSGDDSWGPFQLNFYTADTRRAWERAGILSGESNIISYPQAASNFLAAYRLYGPCPWTAPEYCD